MKNPFEDTEKTQVRMFHGKLTPVEFGRALMGEFNRGNFRAQLLGNEKNLIAQITTLNNLRSGGGTALSISLRQVSDAVAIQIGQQSWLGVAASLGQTIFSTWRNPWNIIGRLDDLAQDLESLQLTDQVWQVIENTAKSGEMTFELSERLRRLVCEYCQTANPVGSASCLACGAPMGGSVPITCPYCGFVVKRNEGICPNCKRALYIPK